MQEQLESIFGEGGNLGQNYENIRTNLWKNPYLREIQYLLQYDHNIKLELNFVKASKDLANFRMIFKDDVQKKKFYQQAKVFDRQDKNEMDTDIIGQHRFFYQCTNQMKAPLPTFARQIGNCFLLTECRVSDTMSKAMELYLE